MIDIRMAEDDADIVLVFRAFLMMHAEGCVPGPINQVKTLTNVARMVRGPNSAVIMAMAGDDELAGVLALVEDGYWWNDDRFLADKGLYVLPNHRDGDAFERLLGAAAQAGDDAGMAVYLTINNIKRKRGGGSKWERIGATLAYTKQGAILAHTPQPEK